MKYRLYSFLKVILTFIMKVFYCVEVINRENIPKDKGVIFVGNHKSNLDCVLLMTSVNRMVRFIAKKELIDGKLGWFFKKMGIIPVDRKRSNKSAVKEAIEVLNNGEVIGIFPEGTFNKSEYVVLPFKMGAVKMAKESNCYIVPFAIINDYKLFRRSVKIIFGKAYKIRNKEDLKGENITLMNKVIKLLKYENN